MSAAVVAVLAAGAAAAPAVVAVIAIIAGKQLAAAVDLAFWVVLAERFDARQSARLVPVITAAGASARWWGPRSSSGSRASADRPRVWSAARRCC
jgi:hypothetical protein